MSYFGGNERLERNNADDYDGYQNHFNNDSSFSNLKEFDKSLNGNENEYGHDNMGAEDGNNFSGTTGLIEHNEMKELEIYDPVNRKNIDYIPAIIKV